MTDRIMAVASALRRINHTIALVVGAVLLATACFVLADITLRQVGISFGGSEEISGYVMAGVASWGLAYALTERAHVRIDLIRLKLRTPGQIALDLVAILALAATALLVSWQAWPVLEKTIRRGSHANTPLETPLWIPQSVWLSGWIWFALSASVLALCALALLARRRADSIAGLVGTTTEVEFDQ